MAEEKSKDDTLTPISTLTATSTTSQSSERQQKSESKLNKVPKAVKDPNLSAAQAINSGLQQEVYPTLRLRLLHSNSTITPQALNQPRCLSSNDSNESSDKSILLKPPPNSLINVVVNVEQSQLQSNQDKQPMTFDQWLLSKRKSEVLHRRQARRIKQHENQLKQLRKQISTQCYTDWLQLKRLARQQLKVPNLPDTGLTEKSQRCLQQWEQRKQQELLQRCKQRQRQKEMQQLDDQLRGQLSQLAWQRWLSQLKVPAKHTSETEKLPEPTSTVRVRAEGGGRARQAMPQQQRCKLQNQLASFFFHVPLSKAQRRLQWRTKKH